MGEAFLCHRPLLLLITIEQNFSPGNAPRWLNNTRRVRVHGGRDGALTEAFPGKEPGITVNDSGTGSAFEKIVGVKGKRACTNEYGSTGDVIGKVAGNENAIGYAGFDVR